ncbi:hypothetical protein [Pseudomonas sp. BF-R-30]|uniref:hypothetical protein n=1 Tax=Pseudomonas sp. BF-R-30 TaxID=2832384 RepID=UPI001CC0A69B|nr:hypothetical protein [Pseudomonas sp. BF-R-30]
MTISQQVDDAKFLIAQGRHIGALTILSLAVAASSRKVFPAKVTKSLRNNDVMRDEEAFTLFLGGRIRRIVQNVNIGPEFCASGFTVMFKGEPKAVEYLIYKYYRNGLVHEADLPEDVEFVESQPGGATFANNGVSVGISCGDKLILDYGWLDVLVKAVVEAPCNGEEFGIKHYKLVANDGIDEVEFESEIIAKYNASQARVNTFKNSVRLLSHDSILSSNDNELIGLFLARVRAGEISGVARLASRGLADTEGRLQPSGLAMLRDIAGAYSLVEY